MKKFVTNLWDRKGMWIPPLVVLLLWAGGAFADDKISQLPAATTQDGTEILPEVQTGQCAATGGTCKATSAQVAAAGTLTGDGSKAAGSTALTITKINGTTPGGSCTNQAVTSVSSSAVPACSTLTSAYVDTSIAKTGTDINTSNQVTATHLAAPLPLAQGGLNTATAPTSAQIPVGNAGGTAYVPQTVSGDGTLSNAGAWAVTKINGTTPGGTCTNQAVTAVSGSAVPTCTTLTSAYVNNSIAATGVDINTSNQVTATHLAAPLPVLQGGSGTTTPSLVAGTNVTITGSWPNQTVNSSGGGSPALTATQIGYGSAGNVLTGTSDFTWTDSTETMGWGSASTGPTLTAAAGTTTGKTVAINGSNAGGSSSTGGNLTITAGGGGTSGGGGGIANLVGGPGGSTTGTGGNANVTGGSVTSGVGGGVTIAGAAGAGNSANSGGAITITAGTGASGSGTGGSNAAAGGALTITGGAAGAISGTATGNNAGGVTINGGNATGNGGGGVVALQGGNNGASGGGNVTLTAGSTISNNSGVTGGSISIAAATGNVGTSGTNNAGAGGTVTISSGNAGAASGGASGNNGGNITVTAGNASGTAGGGDITLNAGTTTFTSGSAGGGIHLNAGAAGVNTTAGGQVTLNGGAGAASSGAGGNVVITGGVGGSTSGNGGSVNIAGGTVTSGTAGSVNLQTAGTSRLTVNGSNGSITATQPIILPNYTIAGLPTCNGTYQYANAVVTNGVAVPTYLGTVSTTGSTIVRVLCNGTNWVYD